MELSRQQVKERQGREAFNILSQIENQINNDEYKLEYKESDINSSLMQTKIHGVINRFSK